MEGADIVHDYCGRVDESLRMPSSPLQLQRSQHVGTKDCARDVEKKDKEVESVVKAPSRSIFGV